MKHKLKLYNTETREKEELIPIEGKTVKMYTCGPTVYNFAHIGNFRTYVFEDLLRRTIQFFDFRVEQAMNLTDIDDKTIKGALDAGITLDAFTAPFKKAFFEDLAALGIEKVEHYPEATEYVEEMISIIQKLLETGVAYVGEDQSVYFSIRKFPSYGRLAHLDLTGLKAGASNRVAQDEYEKEDVSDFVLWKSYDRERDGLIYWESPFGRGRPGWHIECSAMAMKLLGTTIDIHVGGIDNLFPHHENEIAQSESYSCCRFVKHWMHAEHLLVDHKKMSKRLGNFYTLRDLLAKGYTGREVRFALLQAHYRTQLNFTFEGLDAAVSSLRRLEDFIFRLKAIRKEKMPIALDIMLEKALPPSVSRQMKDHLLYAINQENAVDIFDEGEMRPLIIKGLSSLPQKEEVVKDILSNIHIEKQKTILTSILDHAFHNQQTTRDVLDVVVSSIKEFDILDPHKIQPLLQKALFHDKNADEKVSLVMRKLKEKKSQGFILPILVEADDAFKKALGDDLNISVALAVLFDVVRLVNQLCDEGKIGFSEAEDVLDFLKKIDRVLHCLPFEISKEPIEDHLVHLLKERENARLAKDWKKADACRDQILSAGYIIEDTPQGARLKKRLS
ncbi:MAG: cysteinyl-tRNA synthetase [Chlamydiota bacterium]|jgi:cysteinyl-tRNA synthetase